MQEDFTPKEASSSKRHLRIAESIRLEKTSAVIKSNLPGGLVFQTLNSYLLTQQLGVYG